MSDTFDYLRENLDGVCERIERACARSGRKSNEITLVAVTKTVEPERIIRVIDEGISNLGENKVQEICDKFESVNRPCSWHLIGHLQTNKVKYIIDKVSLIHSVDRLELAQEIQKRAEKSGKVMDILVQVNIAQEEQKSGVYTDKLYDLITGISTLRNLRVKGLMTIAPFTEDPEAVRPVFRELNKISVDIKNENIDNINMGLLSMGMSNDFEVAIEEGANIIRVGTAIFGRRHY
jgi:pyridoxal phosphate enzyme (YggS family)